MRRPLSSLFFALVIGPLLPTVGTAQTSDTKPPTLVSFDFNPKDIDVTSASQTITVTARVTDDLSGAPFAFYVAFRSPTGAQVHYGYAYRVSGSNLDSTYSGTVTIPRFVESGTWRPEISLSDQVGNFVFLNASTISASGFPTALSVASIPDVTAPVVQSAVFFPPGIDVSFSDQIVTADIRITDDVSGVDFGGSQIYYLGYLTSPSSHQYYFIPHQEFSFVSGTALDSTWRLQWTIPRFSEAGTWRLFFNAIDVAGNQTFVPAGTFSVSSTTQDLAPPVLTGFTFTPAVIDTSAGSANVTVSMRLTDNLSGVDFALESLYGGSFAGLSFTSPSNGQSRSACCYGFTMTSGTVLDGVWQASIFFPRYSEAGTWKPTINVRDHVRNFLNLSPAQLAAANLPTDLVVVRPSLVGDGSVDAGGGTVNDFTYGARASITFPPGAVSSTTDVAIDVFPDPLAIPTPEGFHGPGTFFVNISLTPVPAYPFAPPGVTATLPLPKPLSPGTAIPLFFVNTTTGTLLPMPDATTGLQVVGTANADGLTATFAGISNFSIVVGLIPNAIQVGLDIKPGTLVNSVNSKSAGTIPVAILSTRTFNAVTTVDFSTLTFGRTGNEKSLKFCNGNGEDINGDGLLDLVCHFDTRSTGFVPGDTAGLLRGRTLAHELIVGTDSVRVVH